eukprot:CAMPEP_0171471654 /NCGR_PEP_ID=MMETSP0946-20130122/832_1 /TAXON_ID=109269 /ORGANISM="Vaucheria litorea, Strain CCMP2940" /LENGTH=241 /DNA_ID=CAMNT_0012001183 /DNA_START=194 /DNA_END=919 /DNA_ORIENTATION=+
MTTDDLAENTRSCIINELSISSSLNHESLCTLVDIFACESHVYAVQELAVCDLFDRYCQRQSYSEISVAATIKQLLEGISYLHKNGVIHRDIKAENVLCFGSKASNKVKLCDFGFAGHLELIKKEFLKAGNNDTFGTLHYMAPEIIRGEMYTYGSDIWSLGILTYSLLSGYFPFDGSSDENVELRIRNSEFRFHKKYWAEISFEAKHFICCMLNKDTHLRWSAHQLLEHDWIREYAMHVSL